MSTFRSDILLFVAPFILSFISGTSQIVKTDIGLLYDFALAVLYLGPDDYNAY